MIAWLAVLLACPKNVPAPNHDGMPRATAPLPDATVVTIEGRALHVNGAPFLVQGVCWSPVGRGGTYPDDLDFAGFVDQDAALMAAAGINVVRTYEPLVDRDVLDVLHANHIYVMNTVYPNGALPVDAVDEVVAAVKDHPAVLLWVVGNEWNYNQLYSDLDATQTVERIEAVAARLQTLDDRPVASVYGWYPKLEGVAETLDAIPSVDIWGINTYLGIDFAGLFEQWRDWSTKPMFLGEYGADAYNAKLPGPDLEAQALATGVLTDLIRAERVDQGGVCSGGTVFEWADEWWKDQSAGSGGPAAQDVGGVAPGTGPHPDLIFNEEWWGLVDIDRNPRPALEALAERYRRDWPRSSDALQP